MTHTLYVGGLREDADAELLRTMFCDFGEIRSARVVVRPSSGKCRGFGYVTFDNDRSANRARAALNGQTLKGRALRVEVAD